MSASFADFWFKNFVLSQFLTGYGVAQKKCGTFVRIIQVSRVLDKTHKSKLTNQSPRQTARASSLVSDLSKVSSF